MLLHDSDRGVARQAGSIVKFFRLLLGRFLHFKTADILIINVLWLNSLFSINDAGIDKQLISIQLVQRTAFSVTLGKPVVHISMPIAFNRFINRLSKM